MRRALIAATLLWPAAALAQSTPNWPNGYVPSAAEWSATWASKLDVSRFLTPIEVYHQAADADYGAAISRACAAGAAIGLGPATYPVSNFSGCAVPNFTLIGIPGKSVIQRQSAGAGGSFFTIQAANVVIDGVTFDSNKAAVSANQWGVLLNAGGQTVRVRHSIFENNSGTLGACFVLAATGPAAGGTFDFTENEVTGCTFNAVEFGSVSNGLVRGNYVHDNTGIGVYIGSFGTVSSTNYARDIQVVGNRFERNATGLGVGGFSPPYIFGTPSAVNTLVANNLFIDNSGSDMSIQGDYTTVIGNKVWQVNTAPNFGILCNSRWSRIEANEINLNGAGFGIDCGGAVSPMIHDNTVVMATSGTAIDPGGTTNGSVKRNRVILTGSAHGIFVLDVEGDASGVPFPSHTSALDIEDNTIEMTGGGTVGVNIYDNAGGFTGMQPVSVRNNRFIGSGGASQANDIVYFAGGAALQISGNTNNGSTQQFLNPNGGGDIVPENVFDQITTSSGAATTVRAVTPTLMNTYNGGGSFMWVAVTAGGSGYTAATTLTATCSTTSPTGTSLVPMISQGAIFSVRVAAVGSGCVGTPGVTATDSGGGSGATFAVTNVPTMLSGRTISLNSSSVTSLLQAGGGATALLPAIPMVFGTNRPPITLSGVGSTFWVASQARLPQFTLTTLPPNNNSTCPAAYNAVEAEVTNSATGKWLARCNGTNWLFPDGTTVN